VHAAVPRFAIVIRVISDPLELKHWLDLSAMAACKRESVLRNYHAGSLHPENPTEKAATISAPSNDLKRIRFFVMAGLRPGQPRLFLLLCC
jgi:hypothetical protein